MNLQDLRRARGFSQERLALAAEIDRGYIGKLENAHYAVSVDILERLALTLGVDPSEFFRPRT